MIKTQYINLNMKPSGVLPVLYCSQYDIGRPLGLVVYSESDPVDLSTYTVTIEATRSDGTAITAGVTTDGNIGIFATTATMTNQADKYLAKLVLFDSQSRRVASLAFVMCVTPATMDENAESIEEDASLYQQYTGTVQTLIAEIREDLADLKVFVTPQMYGAVADGVTDDTTAFQSALNSGLPVFVPEGTYLVSGLSIPNMATVVGCGRKSVIKGDGTGHTITIPSASSYCIIEALTVYGINGHDTYNAIEIADKSAEDASAVYDASHRLRNIATVYGHYGVRVGASIRGCRVEGLTVAEATSDGLHVDGTDNAFLNIGVSLCGGNGIYLSSNNRLASAKPFANAGYGLYISGYSNNITRVDIQQTSGSGIYVSGALNYVQFIADGVGYRNQDLDGNISLLALNNACYNIFIGTIRNGTLSGMMNHIISVVGGHPFGNIIKVTYAEAWNRFALRDVMAVDGIFDPSNDYSVNGVRIYSEFELTIPKSCRLVYRNTSGTLINTDLINFDTFGTQCATSDFAFNSVSLGSGLNVRLYLPETITAQYIYVRAYITTNIDISNALSYEIMTGDASNKFVIPFYRNEKPSDGYIEGYFAYNQPTAIDGVRVSLIKTTDTTIETPSTVELTIKEVEVWTK